MKVHYIDDNKRKIEYELSDWDAVANVADMLLKAPIDIETLYYEDETGQGIFNLDTFCRG